MKRAIAVTLTLLLCLSIVPLVALAETGNDYYLVGYINGADYGIADDSANLGDYKFVSGKVTATFTVDSYVIVKTGDNATWYMTEGWLGNETNTATLADSSTLSEPNKLYVPAGTFTFTLTQNADGTLALSYAEETREPTEPTTSGQDENEKTKYTLTVEVPSNWTTVYIYSWEPAVFGDYPGSVMTNASGNTYKCEIDGNVTNLVFTNQDGTMTGDLKIHDVTIPDDREIKIVVDSDGKATIVYPSNVRPRPLPTPILGEVSNYRVVGNADWLGNWDPAFEGGRMFKLEDGIYRTCFADVPPGSYQIKITKDGKWDGAIGQDGQNFCFTVREKCNIAVDLVFKGDVGIIEVYGIGIFWDEDEEQEENPKSADLMMIFPVVAVLFGAVAVPMLLSKRKEIG